MQIQILGKSYYGSQEHKAHLQKQIVETKERVDPDFEVIAVQTDDENKCVGCGLSSVRHVFKNTISHKCI